jgi:ATP-dependent RNA helicase RhlE
MSQDPSPRTFRVLGLPEPLVDRLDRLGFETPTPIQFEAIPVALTGRDLVGIAQTGTGKTLAFGLPLLARLPRGKAGLVLAPTRELALQISESLRSIGARTAVVIGGASMKQQSDSLAAGPDVIVATPGRLLDHLNQNTLRLDHVSVAVLDEADRMLDMGFAASIRRILGLTPKTRQTMLFSATMPVEIESLARQHLRDPIRIEIAAPGTTAASVRQEVIVVPKDDKHAVLSDLLNEVEGPILVFTRTRHGARKLAKALGRQGYASAELHSDRTLAQRKAALDAFKRGRARVLVATDIAARGIDVKEIGLVINYDLPRTAEDYVHRIGRTGRAGADGHAVTLVTPEQSKELREIEKRLDTQFTRSPRSRAELEPSPPRTPAHVRPAAPKSSSPRPRKPILRGGSRPQ